MRCCAALLGYKGLLLHLLLHDAVYDKGMHVQKAWNSSCLENHTAVLDHPVQVGQVTGMPTRSHLRGEACMGGLQTFLQ